MLVYRMAAQLFKGKPNSKYIQFLRSILVSNASFLLDFLLCLLFVGKLGMNYLLATALSFTAGSSLNYLVSIIWVFEGQKDQRKLEFALFLAISCIGLALNALGMYLLTGLGHVHYLLSRVASASTVFLFNYFSKKYFLFGWLEEHSFLGLAHRDRRG
jgi:putative flippase GtrA